MGSVNVGRAATNTDVAGSKTPEFASRRFHVARPEVAEQLMDGELVIINFASGKYHGVRGSGVAIWHWLDQGHSPEQIMEALADAAPSSHAELSPQIFEFIQELEQQALIYPGTEPLQLSRPLASLPFEAPQIDTLDDMQDYLALDPIHDVDERGWPCKKEQT